MSRASQTPIRILLPVDGSRSALNAVAFVCHGLRDAAGRCEIAVAHVDEPVPVRVRRAVGAAAMRAVHEDNSSRAVEGARRLLARHRIPHETGFLVGDPAAELTAHARSWRADLVMVGARGLGALRAFVLGSTAQRLAASCSVPLIVVRRPPPGRLRLSRVLIATDGGAPSLRALRAFVRLRPLLAPDVRVVVAHVVRPVSDRVAVALALGPQDAHYASVGRAAMKEACALLRARDIAYQELVLVGAPGARIAEVAARRGFDLVVMGSRGRSAARSLLLGSVAQRVLAGCAVPVLLTR